MNQSRLIRWGTIVILVGLAGWYVGAHVGQWKDRYFPRKFRTVETGQIYASGQIDRHLIRQVLSDHGIQVIVALDGDELTDADVVAERTAAREMGIDRVVYPLNGDGTGDIHFYALALTKMADAQKRHLPLLVHCSSGAQRSNGAVGFFRILIQNRDPNEVFAEMQRNGHDPHSNPLLAPYMNSHMAELAGLLVQMGVLDKIPDPVPQIHPG